jgi:5-formyltetrahydrofolate cyclo-ligase
MHGARKLAPAILSSMMDDWEQIREWRRRQRAELLSRRLAVTKEQRRTTRARCASRILENIEGLNPACIGFYWPFKGEIVVRDVIDALLAKGASAALPVVIQKDQPLEFWAWDPATALQPGIWKIPVPAQRRPCHPDILLVPLLGFDPAGYRLGYGGGYYDRTLAQTTPRPRTIGVGYALSQLETIHPQSHDIPMDAIVTEEAFRWL